MAYDEISAFTDSHPNVPVYIMVVQNHPDTKIDVAEKLSIAHESPQIIALGDGSVLGYLNHTDITANAVVQLLDIRSAAK